MAVLKCKMCGGNIEISGDARVIECEYCGTNQTIPDGSDEKKVNLFNRANRLRMDCEFDKAAGVYESIVSEYPEESEGYWGLVLCRFGIEYVDDAATGKKIPTCHRTNTTSIMDDADFEQVLENSDVIAKGTYREEAKAIDRLQRKIISVAESEEPYDVFICYKETDDITKQRTEDSSIAQDIYTELVREGYKVFFSRITLRDKAGTEYEPYIYAALSSAKVMLAIGTKYDYYDAVWVKNEWGRFISMMKNDNTKHLIPCFKNLDAYDIPKEFKNLQALDMGEMMFFKNLIENVERFVSKTEMVSEQEKEAAKETAIVQNSMTPSVEPLLKRVFMFLEDGNWESADEYCEKVLDLDPECARAYLGKLMAELQVKKEDDLANQNKDFEKNLNYQKAIRFGYSKLSDLLFDAKYNFAVSYMRKAQISNEYEESIELFKEISSWKDSSEFIKKCEELLRNKLDEEEREAEAIRRVEEERIVENARKNQERKQNQIKAIRATIATDKSCIAGVCSDGTLKFCGDNSYGKHVVSDWRDIVAISIGRWHIVGLRADMTVVASGYNQNYQCNVSAWRDIIAVSAGRCHTAGLRADGTVVTCGDNEYGQCNVFGWKDITAVSVGAYHTVGLRADGTVVTCGDNRYGQCNASDWKDIIAVSAGTYHTVGLRADGIVVVCGDNQYGQHNALGWKNIVAISAGDKHNFGLCADGTVVACGDNKYGQCEVSDWRDIVAISAGDDYTIGLRPDGTIAVCGYDAEIKCSVSGWTNIALPPKQKTVEELLAFEKEQNTKRILAEKEALAKELPTLGFFAMGRKNEINNRLAEIEQILQNLK